MRHGCWLVCFSVMAMVATVFAAHVQPIQESEVAEMPERLRELLLVRRLISSLRAAEALPELQARPAQGIRKRTCYINAGLSHGCDYKDLVGAMAEKNYWDSLNSPGRRRRSLDSSSYPSSSSHPSSPSSSGDYQGSASLEFSDKAH